MNRAAGRSVSALATIAARSTVEPGSAAASSARGSAGRAKGLKNHNVGADRGGVNRDTSRKSAVTATSAHSSSSGLDGGSRSRAGGGTKSACTAVGRKSARYHNRSGRSFQHNLTGIGTGCAGTAITSATACLPGSAAATGSSRGSNADDSHIDQTSCIKHRSCIRGKRSTGAGFSGLSAVSSIGAGKHARSSGTTRAAATTRGGAQLYNTVGNNRRRCYREVACVTARATISTISTFACFGISRRARTAGATT
jgi:hypothetical protein